MDPEKHISIVISNYNMAATIGKCLEAVFTSEYKNFEVIVVDDKSEDNSVEIIKKFPCKLICLEKHSGASKARNTGAFGSNGDIIFFTDADCLPGKDTLPVINRVFSNAGPEVILGGTYTMMPYDKSFFSVFQSVYVNYSETKNLENPDYIATHAMIIAAETFRKSKGLPENFLPILEDVEFSHRLRKAGLRLVMSPHIQVQHIFNFSLFKSMQNALKKSLYWTMYSIGNRDLLADSGSASVEMKINVVSYFLSLTFLILRLFSQKIFFLYPVPVFFLINGFMNRKLFRAFYETKGALFAGLASLYYMMLYPLPVGTGVLCGTANFIFRKMRVK